MIRSIGQLSILGVLLCPLVASAAEDDQSVLVNPFADYEANVDLDFEIVVPEILAFRVGSDGTVVDDVVFDVSLAPFQPPVTDQSYNDEVLYGDGNAIAASNNGVLEVEIRANTGTVIITTTVDNPSGLDNGDGSFIPFDEISTESDNPGFPAPQLANAAIPPVTVVANQYAGLVTEQIGNWTYAYKNSAKVAAGKYIGVVTYTASSP